MSAANDACRHGHPADHYEITMDGWRTPYVCSCSLCDGDPAGLAYKLGDPCPTPEDLPGILPTEESC